MQRFGALKHLAKTGDSYSVFLIPTSFGLRIESQDGTVTEIAYSDLQLVPVGYMDGQTILRQVSTGDTLIHQQLKLLETLAATGAGELQKQAEQRLVKHKQETFSIVSAWSLIGLLIATCIALLFSATDLVAGWALTRIPPPVETQWGNIYFASYGNTHPIVQDTPAARRVERIGQLLVQKLDATPYNFHFYIEDNSDANAFAVPGGNIIVYSGLERRAQSDDELASVLAHEIGHVLKRHSLQAALHNAGAWLCLQMIFKGRGHGVHELLKQFLNLGRLSFSRSQEHEADLTGIKLAVRANYNPNGLISFFKRLSEETGTGNQALEILSTHPMPERRIADIKAEIQRLKNTQNQ